MTLTERVSKIPGDMGFAVESSEKTYARVAGELLAKGISEDEVMGILMDLYWSAAHCYNEYQLIHR